MRTFTPHRLLWSLLGSAVAPFVGAAIGVAVMLLFGWPDWRVCVFMVSIFVVPVWLLVLMPAYVFIPRASRLWRPGPATAIGAAAGAAIITAYFAVTPDAFLFLMMIFLPVAVLIGGVTGFIASITAPYFHGTSTA